MTIEQRVACLLAALLLCACGDKATQQQPRRVPVWAVAVGDKYDADTGLPLEVKDRATGIVLILVPPTTFIMGTAKANDMVGYEDGRPTHKVRITKPYYIGKYEVTRAQWAAMGGPDPWFRDMSATNRLPPAEARNHPVDQITWKEAHDVIARHGFRLPTEAEWECACAAKRPLPGLEDLEPDALDDVAWYQRNAKFVLQPVGKKQPNALGIHDLQGNVRDYCQDYYDAEAYKKRKDAVTLDPRGPASWEGGKPERVFRGGAVQSPWWALSIADREWAHEDLNPGSTGVRVVRDP